MTGADVLYLSYDGMTDPLGRSQVLPYLVGLAARGHRITLVSFEKPGRSESEMDAVRSICRGAGIDWLPARYHKRPPVLSAMFDVAVMRRIAERLHGRKHFDWVHCRSYLPALVGLRMKRRHGTRLLFDMRGFWADERVEGGLWNLRNPLFASVFRYLKRREAELLRESGHIVSLTESGKTALLDRNDGAALGTPISIIPCCVDFSHFPWANQPERDSARLELGIPPDSSVLAYLGSLGGNYMLEEMLDFFTVYRDRHRNALFLFITQGEAEPIRSAARQRGINDAQLLIRAANRKEVPKILAAADLGIAFKQPSFSAKACSPTKIGEMLAVGLPIIANSGVGDVVPTIEETGGGVAVEHFDIAAYSGALDRLEQLEPDRERWRRKTRERYDLDQGIDRYDVIYRSAEMLSR